MKTYFLLIMIVWVLSGCHEAESYDTENTKIEMIGSTDAKWNESLSLNGKIDADLNEDGYPDRVQLEYEEKEGSMYISRFECEISGISSLFVLQDYDAAFEKLELFDFNEDGMNEIIFMYDTHGTGGEGTHDIYVLWIETDFLKVQKIAPDIQGRCGLEEYWNVDGIYSLDKCLYKGQEKVVVRQYVWGKDGHADQIGDAVSIVSLNETDSCFVAEDSWLDRFHEER